MAHNIGWVEELLTWVENETTTMTSKVDSIVDPDRYRTTDALGVVEKNPRFFKDIQVLVDRLEECEEIAGELVSAIDEYLADCEDKELEEDDCKTCELPQSECTCE